MHPHRSIFTRITFPRPKGRGATRRSQKQQLPRQDTFFKHLIDLSPRHCKLSDKKIYGLISYLDSLINTNRWSRWSSLLASPLCPPSPAQRWSRWSPTGGDPPPNMRATSIYLRGRGRGPMRTQNIGEGCGNTFF